MFHLDITLEDSRVILTSDRGVVFSGSFNDGPTGKSHPVSLDNDEVAALVALMTAGDDAIGCAEHYATLNQVMSQCPAECRPIP